MSIGPEVQDAAGIPLDQNRDGQPGQPDDVFTAIVDLQSPNLAVVAVADPVSAIYGEDIDLSWTVANHGADAAQGTWWDYVYLSTNDTWDLGDALVAKVPYNSASRGVVEASGGSYEGSTTASMPAVVPGDYHIIVRTNLLQTIAETDHSDNIGASTSTASFHLPSLENGVPVSVDVDYRESLYYQIDIPESARVARESQPVKPDADPAHGR